MFHSSAGPRVAVETQGVLQVLQPSYRGYGGSRLPIIQAATSELYGDLIP